MSNDKTYVLIKETEGFKIKNTKTEEEYTKAEEIVKLLNNLKERGDTYESYHTTGVVKLNEVIDMVFDKLDNSFLMRKTIPKDEDGFLQGVFTGRLIVLLELQGELDKYRY